jgi:hypothetical protein
MNDNNQDPQSNVAFNTDTSPDTHSNPFTGDLKGEFSSDFGTNTSAVSQIFNSSGFNSENRTKYIAIGALVIVAVLGLGYFMTSGDDVPSIDEIDGLTEGGIENEIIDDIALDEAIPALPTDGETAPMEEPRLGDAAPSEAMEAPVAEAAVDTVPPSIALVSPVDGAAQSYDETSGPAEFSWEGPADRIMFSRSASMSPLIKSVNLNGATSYQFSNPYPGRWYWQVAGQNGFSEIRSFTISAPERRNFPIVQPTDGGSLAGSGGVVSWQAGEKIARYSVEIVSSGQSFASPQHRFGTSGTSVELQGVAPGSYDIRVGAFSEVAGRWEWQVVRGVSVQ